MPIPTPGRYSIDPAASKISFSTGHLGLGSVRGTFALIEGEIVIDDEPGKSTATAVIDAASVNTRNRVRDTTVKSALFLNASEFPTMTFTSTDLAETGGEGWLLTGNLEAHGQQVQTQVAISAIEATPTGLTASASARIHRHDHGVNGVGAGREIAIELQIVAIK